MQPKLVKFFIASANELHEERFACVDEIVWLNESHEHLYLRPVRWEYTLETHSHYDIQDLQELINPKLVISDLAIFVFYSKLGHYTKVEFEIATTLKKPNFLFFKQGFSPIDDAGKVSYNELITFKKKLLNTFPHHSYNQLVEFRRLLYKSLNLFLSKNYPPVATSEIFRDRQENKAHETITALMSLLSEKNQNLDFLKIHGHSNDAKKTIEQLSKQIAEIQEKLLNQEGIIRRQNKAINNLKLQLDFSEDSNQEKDELLNELSNNNFSKVDEFLSDLLEKKPFPSASDFYKLGTINVIELKYHKALYYFELAVNFDAENSWFLFEAGTLSSTLGYYDKAIEYLSRSLHVLQRHFDDLDTIVIVSVKLGIAYKKKAEYRKSLRYFQKAFDIRIREYGEDQPYLASVYNQMGMSYEGLGDYRQAIIHFEKAVDIYKKFLGEECDEIAATYSNLGSTYDILHQTEKAIDYYKKALAIDKINNPEPDTAAACTLNLLGLAYFNIEEFDLCIENCSKAADIYKKSYGDFHPDLAAAYNNAANGHSHKGQSDLAMAYYSKALEIDSIFHSGPHPEVAIHYMNRAKEYRILGKIDACKADFKKAEENLQILPKHHKYWEYYTLMYIQYFPH